MIVAEGLTKAYGDTVAVAGVGFEVAAGEIVGLLGLAGAGKTTILRMLVGFVHPDEGSATILGKPYVALERPLRRVGVLLGNGAHPARSARDHLRIAAARAGLPVQRVDAVLDLAGLQDKAAVAAGRLTEGERTRLGIATALLGEPEAVIFDEPARGLDAEGASWLHSLVMALAERGCAVLLAGRTLADIGEVGDDVLALDHGSLVARSSLQGLARRAGSEVLVRSPGAAVLAEGLRDAGVAVSATEGDALHVHDAPPRVVGEVALARGVPIWEARSQPVGPDEALEALLETARSSNGDGAHHRDGEEEVPLAETEARLDAELAEVGRRDEPQVIAVVAPGSGFGRTTLTFLLADVLAAATERRSLALALSCDHERLSLPVIREQRTTLALGDLLADLPEFDDLARISPYVAPAPSGAEVLCGARDDEALDALGPPEIDALLDFAGRFYDLVVVDVGALGEPALRALVRRADEVVLLGVPDANGALDPRAPVLDVVDAEREDRATLVVNRVPEERVELQRGDPDRTYALVPEDRELIRALDAGDFELARSAPRTRVALKRLALVVAERLR